MTNTQAAYKLGKIAYLNGNNEIPAHDKTLMVLIETLPNQKDTLKVLKSWTKGYWDTLFKTK